jgi:hypothetical protein
VSDGGQEGGRTYEEHHLPIRQPAVFRARDIVPLPPEIRNQPVDDNIFLFGRLVECVWNGAGRRRGREEGAEVPGRHGEVREGNRGGVEEQRELIDVPL